MTSETRLGEIVTALESVGISSLVMGGHAVRFYGLSRNTNDFELHVAPGSWDTLALRLGRCSLFAGPDLPEGPSWRAHAFRRFRIGTLPDGADEWLEFWRENHLLAPFDELLTRAQSGRSGSRDISFLGLSDLIRSKETEREKDWNDVSRLEEFLDTRLLAQIGREEIAVPAALAQLRSRAGFGTYFLNRTLTNGGNVAAALASTHNPVTQAYLTPFAPLVEFSPHSVFPIEPVVLGRLRTLQGGSPLHLSLVEVVRRRYIQFRKDADRRDKEAILARLGPRDR